MSSKLMKPAHRCLSLRNTGVFTDHPEYRYYRLISVQTNLDNKLYTLSSREIPHTVVTITGTQNSYTIFIQN